MSKDCLFCKIIAGEIPSTEVYRDDEAFAFEDINPQAPHHVLVIPKGPYVSLDDFTAAGTTDEIAGFMRAVGETARQLNLANPGYRILANIGRDGMQEVPHLHIHILGGRSLGPMLKSDP